MEEQFPDIDENRRRYNTDVPIFRAPSMGDRPNLCYEYKGVTNPHPSGWRVERAKLQAMDDAGDIIWRTGKTPLRKSYADEYKGKPVGSLWTDIPPAAGAEYLGYQTQKPLALLNRIVKASSNPGDVVFDPFCGCGTTVYSAHLNDRQWIGCDIAVLSLHLMRDVLYKRYDLQENIHYQVSGVPTSIDGAHELSKRDPHQFQIWAITLAGGFCSSKKSDDKGVDGRIYFVPDLEMQNMVISVKGGKTVNPAQIRELRGTLERENCLMAGFICLSNPTKGMIREANEAGEIELEGIQYPRLQIRTIQQLLDGTGFDTPVHATTLNWGDQLNLFSQ